MHEELFTSQRVNWHKQQHNDKYVISLQKCWTSFILLAKAWDACYFVWDFQNI